jgi:alpha-1,6-mannosyltransferase
VLPAVLLHYGTLVLVFGLYLRLLLLAHGLRGGAALIAISTPVVASLGLLFVRPFLSTDSFTYVIQGYFGVTQGTPYLSPATDFISTPLAPTLTQFGYVVGQGESPYGALWGQVEILAVKLGAADVWTAVVLMKVVVLGATLGSAGLIWRILGTVAPASRLVGTLAYLWNPVVVIEFAAEGHNDSLMIFFVLLALSLAIEKRNSGSVLALSLGVLTKYVPLIVFPPLLVYMWRTRRTTASFIAGLVPGLVMALGIGVIILAPLWIGDRTFAGVIQQGRLSMSSLPGALRWIVDRLGPAGLSAPLTLVATSIAFSLVVLTSSLKVRDAAGLLRACAVIATTYVFVVSGVFWPWYVAAPIALLLLSPSRGHYALILVLSVASRMVAPLDDLRASGVISFQQQFALTVTFAVIPGLAAVGWLIFRDLPSVRRQSVNRRAVRLAS